MIFLNSHFTVSRGNGRGRLCCMAVGEHMSVSDSMYKLWIRPNPDNDCIFACESIFVGI